MFWVKPVDIKINSVHLIVIPAEHQQAKEMNVLSIYPVQETQNS